MGITGIQSQTSSLARSCDSRRVGISIVSLLLVSAQPLEHVLQRSDCFKSLFSLCCLQCEVYQL